jgi:hypothetical protein
MRRAGLIPPSAVFSTSQRDAPEASASRATDLAGAPPGLGSSAPAPPAVVALPGGQLPAGQTHEPSLGGLGRISEALAGTSGGAIAGAAGEVTRASGVAQAIERSTGTTLETSVATGDAAIAALTAPAR